MTLYMCIQTTYAVVTHKTVDNQMQVAQTEVQAMNGYCITHCTVHVHWVVSLSRGHPHCCSSTLCYFLDGVERPSRVSRRRPVQSDGVSGAAERPSLSCPGREGVLLAGEGGDRT